MTAVTTRKKARAVVPDEPVFTNRSGADLVGVRHATVPDLASAGKAENAMDIDDLWLGESIDSMLDAIPEPERFYMAVTQVLIKKKVGSIIIPDTAVDDQQWTAGAGLVVKVGRSVYKGRRFEDIGLTEADTFKPGDVVHFNAGAAPRRIRVDGRVFLFITDDAVISRIPRAHLHRLSFTI